MNLITKMALALSASALIACGGGGGSSSSDAITLTYETPTLNATFYNGQQNAPVGQGPQVTVRVAATGSLTGTAYVVVTDSNRAFAGSAISAYGGGGGHYVADLTADASLPPGTYTGQLAVKVCRDALCTSPYPVSGGVLPYTITIVPKLAVEVYVAGVLVDASSGVLDAVPRNTAVEIRSNVPIAVTFSTDDFTLNPASTPTDWQAVLISQIGLISNSQLIIRTTDATQSFQPAVFINVPFAPVVP